MGRMRRKLRVHRHALRVRVTSAGRLNEARDHATNSRVACGKRIEEQLAALALVIKSWIDRRGD